MFKHNIPDNEFEHWFSNENWNVQSSKIIEYTWIPYIFLINIVITKSKLINEQIENHRPP